MIRWDNSLVRMPIAQGRCDEATYAVVAVSGGFHVSRSILSLPVWERKQDETELKLKDDAHML